MASRGTQANEVPDGGLLGFMQEHFLEAKAALLEGVSGEFMEDKQSGCEECTEKVAKHIAEAAMAKMIAKCEVGKGCPHACRQLKEDPKVVLGMLLVKSRPVELAEMFCAGRGVCSKKDAMGGEAGFHRKAMMMYMEADRDDFKEVIEKAGEMASVARPGGGHGLGGGLMEPLLPTDRECMHKQIQAAMEKVEGRMATKCEAVEKEGKKCRFLQKACEFKEENPEVFHGAMLAKVEPWKYAMGFCAPHKEAPHPISAALDWVRKAKGSALCHRTCGWDRACHKRCAQMAFENLQLKPLPLLAV